MSGKSTAVLRLLIIAGSLHPYHTFSMDHYRDQLLLVSKVAMGIGASWILAQLVRTLATVDDTPRACEDDYEKHPTYLSADQIQTLISTWHKLNAARYAGAAQMKAILLDPNFDFRLRTTHHGTKPPETPYALALYQENHITYARPNSFGLLKGFFGMQELNLSTEASKEIFPLLLDAGIDLQSQDPLVLKHGVDLRDDSNKYYRNTAIQLMNHRGLLGWRDVNNLRQGALYAMAKEHLANKPKIKQLVREALHDVSLLPIELIDMCADYVGASFPDTKAT